jgi:hypothetical protein
MAAKVPYRDRRVRWSGVLEEWRTTGLSRREFCASRGLALWQFHYWHSRLIGVTHRCAKRRPEPAPGKGEAVFVPVTCRDASGVRLRVGCLELVLEPEFDEATLGRLLRVLQEQGPC